MDALASRAWRGVAMFAVALAVLIFLPAWTLAYWQGWAYWIVFTLGLVAITAYFLRRDPSLIARRLDAGPAAERERTQKRIQAASSLCLCLTFVVSGLDRRFGWSPRIAPAIEIAADVLGLLAFYVVFRTFRENSHASAIIEVSEDQRVVSTGPYGIVRHPMYAGAMLLFVATPIALGSLWAGIPAAGLAAALVARIVDEERYLLVHLRGYDEYCRRVRARLVPGVW